MIEYIENPESILVESEKKKGIKKVVEKEEISSFSEKNSKHNKMLLKYLNF